MTLNKKKLNPFLFHTCVVILIYLLLIILFFFQKNYTVVKLRIAENKQLSKQIEQTYDLIGSLNLNLNFSPISDVIKFYDYSDLLFLSNKKSYFLKSSAINNYYECCINNFKKKIYKKNEIYIFMKNYSEEKINYNFAIRDLSTSKFNNENNELLLMINLNGKSKDLERKILFEFVEYMNEISVQNYKKDLNDFFYSADTLSKVVNKILKNMEKKKIIFNNKSKIIEKLISILQERKIFLKDNYSSIMSLHFDKEEYQNYLKIKFLMDEINVYNNYDMMLRTSAYNYRTKAYNYQYNFDEKIDEIRNINYNFNETFYVINETLFNQKKYINSKLFILMLSSFFAFSYIWIVFLISKLRKKNE